MITFWRSYRAEFLKRKHSLFFWLHLAIPFILVVMLDLYLRGRNGGPNGDYFFRVFYEIIGFAYPLVIAVLCGLVTSQEEQAGQFQVMLGKVPQRITTYLSQLGMLLTMGFLSMTLAVGGFTLSARWLLGVGDINYNSVLYTGFLVYISVIFLYCLSLLLGYLFGIGICSLIGFLGIIVAALSETSLGESVWVYLPWAWAIRFGMGLGIQNGLIWMGVMTSCILMMSALWFRNWEGRRFTGSLG